MRTPASSGPAAARIAELDALRGFALCGIIFINIPKTMGMLDVAARAPCCCAGSSCWRSSVLPTTCFSRARSCCRTHSPAWSYCCS